MSVHIRTMADDLAAVTGGAAPNGDNSTGLGTLVPLVAGKTTTSTTPAARRGLPIGLPARLSRGRGSSRITRLLVLVAAGVAVLGSGLWLVLTMVPRTTGTVADTLPSETLAFISVAGMGGTGEAEDAGARTFVETVRTRIVQAVGELTIDRLRAATDVTYLLLPGSSPAEPIPALLVRGMDTVDLSQAPRLGTKKIRGGLLIAESTVLGRLEGLHGTAWSKDAELRVLFHGLPAHPPILLGFRSSALAALLKPFTVVSTPAQSGVLAVVPSDTGDDASLRGRFSDSWRDVETKTVVTRQLAERLPESTIFAFQTDGPALARAVLGGGEGAKGSTPVVPGLEALQRALAPQQETVEKLLGLLTGPGVVGVLPTSVPAVRDVVAVLPLRSGVDAPSLLRQLELAFREVGPVLTGGTFPTAAFEEREYNGAPLRYMNFGTPGRAVDYVVTDDYLLLATSRESALALVDTVRGGRTSLAASPAFRPLQEVVAGARWVFVQDHPSLRTEFSPTYQTYPLLLRALALRPVAGGMVEGRLVLPPAAAPVPEPSALPLPLPEPDVSPTTPPPAFPAP